MTQIALLRHGHTSWNRAGRIQGRTDIPLDDAARADLTRLQLPEMWQRADLVSSPLQRATETAQILTGRAPHPDPALMEMDWGAWEGLRGADLSADPASGFRHLEAWGWDYRPPEGESPADLRARLIPWAESRSAPTLAVCHIGVMRVLMAHATGWNLTGSAPFQIKRARLYVIEIEGRMWRHLETVRLEARAG